MVAFMLNILPAFVPLTVKIYENYGAAAFAFLTCRMACRAVAFLTKSKKRRLVEVPGIEPGSTNLPLRVSTCLFYLWSFPGKPDKRGLPREQPSTFDPWPEGMATGGL